MLGTGLWVLVSKPSLARLARLKMVIALGRKGEPGGNSLKEAKMQHYKINNMAERKAVSRETLETVQKM